MDDHYLQKYAIGPIPDSLVKQYVARFVDQEGAWNWGLFASLLPNHILFKIAGTMRPCERGVEDCCFWGTSKSSCFTVKSAYFYLFKPVPSGIILFGVRFGDGMVPKVFVVSFGC